MRIAKPEGCALACDARTFFEFFCFDNPAKIEYHASQEHVAVRIGDWSNDSSSGRLRREVRFQSPIHAPKRVLQIIGKEYTEITERFVVDSDTLGITVSYLPDTLQRYCNIQVRWIAVDVDPASAASLPAAAAAAAAAEGERQLPVRATLSVEISVGFDMPIVGHLFEAFMIRSAEKSAVDYLAFTARQINERARALARQKQQQQQQQGEQGVQAVGDATALVVADAIGPLRAPGAVARRAVVAGAAMQRELGPSSVPGALAAASAASAAGGAPLAVAVPPAVDALTTAELLHRLADELHEREVALGKRIAALETRARQWTAATSNRVRAQYDLHARRQPSVWHRAWLVLVRLAGLARYALALYVLWSVLPRVRAWLPRALGGGLSARA